jgi:hypothetical protein
MYSLLPRLAIQKTLCTTRNTFERMPLRLEGRHGRLKKLRNAAVGPVFESLRNYFGLRRANNRGKTAAGRASILLFLSADHPFLERNLKVGQRH